MCRVANLGCKLCCLNNLRALRMRRRRAFPSVGRLQMTSGRGKLYRPSQPMTTLRESATARDELGAHVSSAGGVQNAPARAAEIDAVVLQLFTKQPSRWAEPRLDEEAIRGFAEERRRHGIVVAGAHDSYLINLSSPDRRLWRMSQRSFQAELVRCAALDLDFLVTHPGNAIDGDTPGGIARNAKAIGESMDAAGSSTRLLLELTAGSGTSVGGSFEALAALLERIPAPHRDRVGVCLDTCHAYSAGYDLVGDYEGVWSAFARDLGMERLGLIHLNDSKNPRGSHKDRHEHIGKGWLGEEPFRRLMLDDRLRRVPKVLETPKDDDALLADRANLALLRSFRASGSGGPRGSAS
jgi:deoxyribonuclease IV